MNYIIYFNQNITNLWKNKTKVKKNGKNNKKKLQKQKEQDYVKV